MKLTVLAGLFFLLFSLPLLAQEQSLQVEERVPNNVGINPFNYDNVIYTKNKTYVYDYFIVKGADKFKYKITSDSSGKKLWNYVPATSVDSNTVCYLGLKTLDKIGPIMMDKPAYNQTEVFLYHYNTKIKPLDTELTGVIENKKNVWVHPFRFNALEILQLSPFPYIKLPYQKGQTYSWNLVVGEKWPEFKSFDWKGSLSLKCSYTVRGKELLALPFGKFQTIKVEATAITEVGNSSLVSYFNEQYGFVKLVYRNIDNSQVIITLRAINQ